MVNYDPTIKLAARARKTVEATTEYEKFADTTRDTDRNLADEVVCSTPCVGCPQPSGWADLNVNGWAATGIIRNGQAEGRQKERHHP